MITSGSIITILKELGLLNFVSVILVINMPSMLFVLAQGFKIKCHFRGKYADKKDIESVREDFKSIRKDFKDLTMSIIKLEKTIVRHDERLKQMPGRV